MPVTKDDLLVAIKADTKDANVQLAAFAKNFDKLDEAMNAVVSSLNKTEKQITGLGMVMLELNAAVELGQKAWDMLAGPISRAIDEAEQAATAFDKARITLKFFGEKDADKAAQGFENVAASIEEATGASAESTLVFAAQAKAFGLSNDKVEELLKASADLAAIMGTDVDSAGRTLLATMNGQTRAVEKYVPLVKGMTEAQLKDGAAIDIVSKSLGGLGEAFGKTAEGINKRLDASIGNAFEEAGKVIVEAFDVIATKESKIRFFEDLQKSIIETKPLVLSFVQGLKESFAAIAIASTAAFVVSNIGAWVKSIQIATAAVKAQSVATLFLAKAQGILNIAAVKFVGLASLFLLVGAAIESVAKNADHLGDVFGLVFNRALAAGNRLISIFSKLTGNDDAAKRFADAADDYAIAADRLGRKVDVGTFGKALQSITNFSEVAQGNLTSLNKEAKQTKDIMAGITAPEGLAKTGQMTKEVADKLRDLGGVIANLNAQAQMAPGNEMQAIKAKLAADQMSLDNKAQEIANSDKLAGKEALRLAEIGKRIQAEITAKEIGEKQQKILDEQISRVNDLTLEYNSYGKSQREILDLQMNRALELIDLEEQRLEKSGMLTEEIKQQMSLQRGGVKANTENRKKDTISTAFEDSKKIGDEIGKAISGQFSEGIQGQIMGMMSGIGSMVSAAQAVVDAGPQLLDSIANLIGSVTELPLKLLNGVTQIFNNLSGFFENFISNIGTMVNGLLDAIVGFIEKIPDILVKFITDIPRIIGNLFDKLPDIIQRLITALIEATPQIAIGLISFLVKDAPKIALGIIKTLVIELPKALLKAIGNAFKNIFKSIFGGGGSMLADAGKAISNGFSKGIQKLSGIGSKLFGVKDLADSIGADEKANEILEQIQEAGKEAYDWITKAWIWVRDNILMPLWDFIVLPFKYSWELLKTTFYFVVDLLKGAWEGLKAAAYFVRDLFMAVWNFVKGIFQGIIDTFMALWRFVSTLFDDPIKAFKGLWEDLKNIFSNAIKNFGSFFENIGNAIGDYGRRIWDGFVNALKSAGNFFADIGKTIWDGLWEALSKAGNFFANLFKFDGGGRGGVEKFLGFDFPWVAFNKGGVVEGKATMPGDHPKNDTVAALLSPGEVVLSREMMKDPAFARVVQNKFEGKKTDGHFLGKLGDAISSGFKSARDFVGGGISSAGDWLGDKFKAAGKVGSWIKDRIADLPQDAMNGILSAIEGAQRLGKGAIEFISKGLFELMPDWIKELWNSISRFITSVDLGKLVKDPKGALEDAISKFKDVFSPMFLKMTDPARDVLKMNNGGLVPGVRGEIDTRDARLTPGEFVMSQPAVQRIGVGTLNALNKGQSVKSEGSYTFNINMKFDMKDPVDESTIKNRILPRMKEELKRASENGEYILNAKGFRS